MEALTGEIYDWTEDGRPLIVGSSLNLDLAIRRKYKTVTIVVDDGRRITQEQRAKIYVLMKFISEYSGDTVEGTKHMLKMAFVLKHWQRIEFQMFSLSDCSITTAREFISDIIDFIVEHDIPCDEPLWKLTDDSGRYVYSCLMRKVCCVCGQPAELHHVDAVGMGSDRKKINHLGRRCLPLCREHHTVIHSVGARSFCEMYHLLPVKIDKEIARKYKLNAKGKGR